MQWRNSLFIIASQTRLFWDLRKKYFYWAFLVHRRLFGFKGHVRENKIQTSTLLQFIRVTIKQIILSSSFAIGLLVIDSRLSGIYKAHHVTVAHDVYNTLLATVTSMGGILVGLYYAATTAIGGATYSHVPNEVRELLAHERIGNVYMRFLASLTFFGLVLIAFNTVGYPPIILAIPIFVIAAGIAILAFVTMGVRAFDLFDPTFHSFDLIEQIRRNYLRMTPREYRWLDPSFQNYAHNSARAYLDTIKSLTGITASENYSNGQPYLKLSSRLLSFLINYEAAKKKIPTESHWYERRYKYPDWYRTDDSTTSITYQTSTRLQPKAVSNREWIEDDLIPIVYDCLTKNAQLGRYEIVISLLTLFGRYITALAGEHEVKAAFQNLDDLVTKCSGIFFEPLSNGSAQETLERLSIGDWLASVPIDILLAYLESCKKLSRDSIAAAIADMRWRATSEIYETNLPAHLLPQFEWLLPHLQFELASEGNKISPDWYVCELVLQSASENAKESTRALVDAAQSLYDKLLNAALQNGLIWVRATTLTRESEYWSKLDAHFGRFRERWTDLGADRRIDGLTWPNLDFDNLDSLRKERKKRLLQMMSHDATTLSLGTRPETYPDFAGQFLHTVGEALFVAMEENDAATLEQLFPDFFNSSLLQFNHLLSTGELPEWQATIAMKIAVSPVLDLMDLTGYSIFFSEFYGNSKLDEQVRIIWNSYLDSKLKEGKPILQVLKAAVELTESAFELAHRSMIRGHWSQEVSHKLQELERKQVRMRGSIITKAVVLHKSALVRVFARDEFGSMYDGIDIFIENVVRKRSDGADIKFSGLRASFNDSIAREKKGTKNSEIDGIDGDEAE